MSRAGVKVGTMLCFLSAGMQLINLMLEIAAGDMLMVFVSLAMIAVAVWFGLAGLDSLSEPPKT